MYMASHAAETEVVCMEKQRKEVMLPPLLLNIPEVCKSLRLSRAKVYRLIDYEGLPVVRFGRAVRVPHALLQQWVEQRMKQSA
jgi:excisionase family DNA binding protein